jgi:transketolase
MTTITSSGSDHGQYEKVKDLIDECIDLMLNYRQSGHPGGSRSKVHIMVSLLLSGAMRWDIRRPWLRFADRFVLAAGHTVPLVYAVSRSSTRACGPVMSSTATLSSLFPTLARGR